MRFILVLLFAIALSIGGTYLLQQPDIRDRAAEWAEVVANAIDSTMQSVTGEPAKEAPAASARSFEEPAERAGADSVFWLNQGLSLFYTLLGVVASEVVRGVSDRRRRIAA